MLFFYPDYSNLYKFVPLRASNCIFYKHVTGACPNKCAIYLPGDGACLV